MIFRLLFLTFKRWKNGIFPYSLKAHLIINVNLLLLVLQLLIGQSCKIFSVSHLPVLLTRIFKNLWIPHAPRLQLVSTSFFHSPQLHVSKKEKLVENGQRTDIFYVIGIRWKGCISNVTSLLTIAETTLFLALVFSVF